MEQDVIQLISFDDEKNKKMSAFQMRKMRADAKTRLYAEKKILVPKNAGWCNQEFKFYCQCSICNYVLLTKNYKCHCTMLYNGEMGKVMPVKVNTPKTFNTEEQDEKVAKWL